MSDIELLCAARPYLDLTFTGLLGLPRPGREAFATGLLRSPGGGALNAIAAARLGLRTAGAFVLGDDEAGEFLRAELAREGILLVGEPRGRTAVTVVLPYAGDRAFVTYDPETQVDLRALTALCPERVIYTIDQVSGPALTAQPYVTIGDREASRYARSTLPQLPPHATVFLNAGEGAQLTGQVSVSEAARTLAEWAEVVVITRGSAGALACTADVVASVPSIEVDPVDTTGAGDLFAAAWIWAEAQGFDLEDRLRWAVLYSALSVTVSTAAAGAIDLDTLLAAGRRRGLPVPQAARRGIPAPGAAQRAGVC
jgi:ribokinase